MSKNKFVHLHLHSEYSVLDGAAKISSIIETVKRYGMNTVALTDHGNLFGAFDFYREALKHGIKPIIGCEAYVAPGDRRERQLSADTQGGTTSNSNFHLTLLVRHQQGYKNLIQLISLSYLEGFYYKPRMDKELLSRYHEGLIALSGCVNSEIATAILHDRLDWAQRLCGEYLDIFGKDHYFLEVQKNGAPGQEKVNAALAKFSRSLNIPLVATNDSHYLTPDDYKAHDVLLCISTNRKIQDTDRLRFSSNDYYIRSPEEMGQLFKDTPEALSQSALIAEPCAVQLDLDKGRIPSYAIPPGFASDNYLRHLCEEGLRERYPTPSDLLRERLNKELTIIQKKGFCDYFLIVWDLVRFAQKKGIPVGPGRGSAAGSLVAYTLGITRIDPIKYHLIFERFLNPERNDFPDIDIDFCQERRSEVLQYIYQRYGDENVANIITFGTMGAKAVIRDVGRVLGIPLIEVDQMAKKIPLSIGITLKEALAMVPELKTLYGQQAGVKEWFDIALRLEGLCRHVSTHAAGIVISDKPLTEYVPIYMDPQEKQKVIQYPMEVLPELGLLKIDILGLKNLTVIHKTLELIQKYKGLSLDLDHLNLADERTFDLLGRAQTKGVFQLESSGFRDLLLRLKPTQFEDIIAALSLYRPGPLQSGMVDTYIQHKTNREEIPYLHPRLKPFLEETNGVILYQEQVMQIAHELGGLSMEEADVLRKAMGKKIPELLTSFRGKFVQGAKQHDIDRTTAEQIFDLMEYFSGYGFNKSHSTAYAMISYTTAYLKTNYPLEFMTALLSYEKGHIEKISEYISECRSLGIAVLPPDINRSEEGFSIEEKKIRFGLEAIKNVGRTAVASLLNARTKNGPFAHLVDFCSRVDLRVVNKEVLSSLIRCGACDSWGVKRQALLSMLDEVLEYTGQADLKSSSQQKSLFIHASDSLQETLMKRFQSLPSQKDSASDNGRDFMLYEKELLGIYLTQDPLWDVEDVLRTLATTPSEQLKDLDEGTPVLMGGLIEGVKRLLIKAGPNKGQHSLLLKMRDLQGFYEAQIYPGELEKMNPLIQPNSIIFLLGRKSSKKDTPFVKLNRVIPLEHSYEELSGLIELNVSSHVFNEAFFTELKTLFERHPGTKTHIHLIVEEKPSGEQMMVRCGPTYKIQVTQPFLETLHTLVGADHVRIKPFAPLSLFPKSSRSFVPSRTNYTGKSWSAHHAPHASP